MKAIAIWTAILIMPVLANGQSADHLKRNHKFHKHNQSIEKSDQMIISSGMSSLKPVSPQEHNRKFHMTAMEIVPVQLKSGGHDHYLARNRKFHRSTVEDAPSGKKFNNDFPNPPVLSNK